MGGWGGQENLSDEILHRKDIIGGLLVPFLTLEFNYVRKDMRRRVYAMEDDAFAKVNIIWVGGGGQENLSDEILHGKDIIGGLLVPFLTLAFNYVRKDMRRRVYAMEDDAFAKVNIIWCGGGDVRESILTHTFNAKCFRTIILNNKQGLAKMIVPFRGYGRHSPNQVMVKRE